jgi:hypothetical protein
MSTSEVEWNQLRRLMYAANLGGFWSALAPVVGLDRRG